VQTECKTQIFQVLNNKNERPYNSLTNCYVQVLVALIIPVKDTLLNVWAKTITLSIFSL
jgi:hypothetical protein